MYNYLDIVPEVTFQIMSPFNNGSKKPIAVSVKAGKDNIKGNLQLELPEIGLFLLSLFLSL
jgi:hypothetical protein